MRKLKSDVRAAMRERGLLRIFGLRVFSYILFLSGAATAVPCLLCAFYTPSAVVESVTGLKITEAHAGLAAGAEAVLAALSLLFVIMFFSVRFALACEFMYVGGRGLAPPENMMTLKNGIRYFAFLFLFLLMRIRDGVRYFLPSGFAAVLLAVGVRYGMTAIGAAVSVSAFAAVFLLGLAYYISSGVGGMRGAGVLYLSPLASPVTAAKASASAAGDIKKSLRRAFALLPYRLTALVPVVRIIPSVYIRKYRAVSALTDLIAP